mgnify:FL=1
MTFAVRMKNTKKMLVLRILCISMIALITWFISWEPMQETLMEENAYLIFVGFIVVFFLLFAFSFYAQRRPRIEVDGQDIAFYPKWGPSKRVFLSEITSRKEKPDYYDPKQAAVAGALGGGLLAYIVTKRNASTMATPKAMIYTYYSGDTKLITVSTREMENVERFDQLVRSKLEGKPLAGEFTAAVEEPVKKGKSPFLLAGVAGVVCVAVVCAAMFILPDRSTGDPTPPVTSANPGSEQDTADRTIIHSTRGVTFVVSADWTQAEGLDMFYTDKNEVYGLNGVSPLGFYEPQVLFEELAAYYEGQFDTLSAPEELTPWQSGDGVECLTADLTGVYESVLYCTKIVIAPQKNLVLTFDAQAYKDRQEPTFVWMILNELCESLTFETGTRDEISGNTFLCGDGSQLCLQDSGDFRWYQSAEDHEKPYYEGVYEVYYGQAAMDKVASMTEYGLTMEELERVLAANMNGYIPGGSRPSDYFYATGELEDNRERYQVCLDTFYAVILHNQRLVSSPEDVREGGNSVLYIGFYLPELEMADLTNCNAMSYTQWTFQEKTA